MDGRSLFVRFDERVHVCVSYGLLIVWCWGCQGLRINYAAGVGYGVSPLKAYATAKKKDEDFWDVHEQSGWGAQK